jgi:hypothetical protein
MVYEYELPFGETNSYDQARESSNAPPGISWTLLLKTYRDAIEFTKSMGC